MARAGQELHGPDGFRLLIVSVDEDVLVMEATYAGTGGMPPEHRHPRQAERFTVLEGAMLTVIGEAERRYAAGETFDVPPDTPHRMGADGPTRTRWEVRPALRTAEFFERLYSGEPPSADLLAEFREEIRVTGFDPPPAEPA